MKVLVTCSPNCNYADNNNDENIHYEAPCSPFSQNLPKMICFVNNLESAKSLPTKILKLLSSSQQHFQLQELTPVATHKLVISCLNQEFYTTVGPRFGAHVAVFVHTCSVWRHTRCCSTPCPSLCSPQRGWCSRHARKCYGWRWESHSGRGQHSPQPPSGRQNKTKTDI